MAKTLDELRDIGRKTEAILSAVNPDAAETVENRFQTLDRAGRAARMLVDAGVPWTQSRGYQNANEFIRSNDMLVDVANIDDAARADIDALIGLDDDDLVSIEEMVWASRRRQTAPLFPTFVASVRGLEDLIRDVPRSSGIIIGEIDSDGDIPINVHIEGGIDTVYLRGWEHWGRELSVDDGDAPLWRLIASRVQRELSNEV